MSNVGMKLGLGQRPTTSIVVVTGDGQRFDLGHQVEGDDYVARWYQWRQRRKVYAYCRTRLATLTGNERQEFLTEMEARRG